MDQTIRGKIKLAQPLDSTIANVEIGTGSNRVNGPFKLEVTASFGSGRIRLDLEEGGQLEVTLSIKEAHIHSGWIQCDALSVVPDDLGEADGGENVTFLREETYQSRQGGHIRAYLKNVPVVSNLIGVEADGKLSGAKEKKVTKKSEAKFAQVPYHGCGEVHIHRPEEGTLKGQIPKRMVVGTFQPEDPELEFLIYSELRVKEDWLEPLDPTPLDVTEDFMRRWNASLATPNEERRALNRDAFSALVAHLVRLNLQTDIKSPFAVLAVDALSGVYADEDGERHLIPVRPPYARQPVTESISISAVLDAMEKSPDTLMSFLEDSGVSQRKLAQIKRSHESLLVEKGERIFFGTGDFFDGNKILIPRRRWNCEYYVFNGNSMRTENKLLPVFKRYSVRIQKNSHIIHEICRITKTKVNFQIRQYYPALYAEKGFYNQYIYSEMIYRTKN